MLVGRRPTVTAPSWSSGSTPTRRSTIPENVSATILPKTLFGEKYVSLEVPAGPAGRRSRPATRSSSPTSRSSSSRSSTTCSRCCAPCSPEQLNYTLTAVANALEGRGEKIGAELRDPRRLPARSSTRASRRSSTASTSSARSPRSTSRSTPELTRLLRNTVTTTNTFESTEQQVKALFDDVAGFSGTARDVPGGERRQHRHARRPGPQILPLLARYSPEYKCFLAGAVASIHPNEQAFRNKTLHIILETLPRQPRALQRQRPAGDERAPRSVPLLQPACTTPINGKYGQDNLPPRQHRPEAQRRHQLLRAARQARRRRVDRDVVSAPRRTRACSTWPPPRSSACRSRQVPDVTSLLLGPLAQGKAVDVR